jgi:hypothetical protein
VQCAAVIIGQEGAAWHCWGILAAPLQPPPDVVTSSTGLLHSWGQPQAPDIRSSIRTVPPADVQFCLKALSFSRPFHLSLVLSLSLSLPLASLPF